MRNVSYLLVALAFLVVPACGGDDSTGPSNGDDPGNGSGSVAAEITMDDLAFIAPDGSRNQNATVTIQVGETVRWTNNDDVAHTVTSGEGSFGDDGDGLPEGASNGLESGNIGPDGSYEFTFETAGTWTYLCELHPTTMINATIVVQE